MRPEFENLTKGRHVYYTNDGGNEEAAIVAWVHKLDDEPTENGLVNLLVIDRNGCTRGVVNVPYEEHGDLHSWRWMHTGQSAVSVMGSKPTMLAPAVAQPTMQEMVNRLASARMVLLDILQAQGVDNARHLAHEELNQPWFKA